MSEKEKYPNEHDKLKGLVATVGTMAVLAAGVAGATKLQESRNHYGYEPARNSGPPANIDKGIDPANILKDHPEK
jgi:hypothetical protein